MALFNFGKKKKTAGNCECKCSATKTEEKTTCTCDKMSKQSEINDYDNLKIETDFNVKVLGGGCAKCNELEANAVAALLELGMDTKIEHITDFSVIATYGVMCTPALVIDSKVVSSGKVLKKEEIVTVLRNIRG